MKDSEKAIPTCAKWSPPQRRLAGTGFALEFWNGVWNAAHVLHILVTS
jgi:hypothetical protein